jgi:hypothetical protein
MNFPKNMKTLPILPSVTNLTAFRRIRKNASFAAPQKLLESNAIWIYAFLFMNLTNRSNQFTRQIAQFNKQLTQQFLGPGSKAVLALM